MTTRPRPRIAIAGGGAAGFFAAIACAEANPSSEVVIYEATAHPLAKVRVSGGGRCNVTHACEGPDEMAAGYPRGSRELLGPLHRFGQAETADWFAARGVRLKTEADGRMFPVTDSSATIVECLLGAAAKAGVRLVVGRGIRACARAATAGSFAITLSDGAGIEAERLLLATGGTRGTAGLSIAETLGHAIVPPVPSLFTFHVSDSRLSGLEGLSVPLGEASVPGRKLKAAGPVLITHWGLSGPAILRLSAFGAREFHDCGYRFTVRVNWAAPRTLAEVRNELAREQTGHARRQVASANPFGIPARFWQRLAGAATISPESSWAHVSKSSLDALAEQVAACQFEVSGKSMYKEEFVTCGGIRLREVDFATMESRRCPGLHFAGEILDIDGITGGYNFQAAWTTGWIAGQAMAAG